MHINEFLLMAFMLMSTDPSGQAVYRFVKQEDAALQQALKNTVKNLAARMGEVTAPCASIARTSSGPPRKGIFATNLRDTTSRITTNPRDPSDEVAHIRVEQDLQGQPMAPVPKRQAGEAALDC